MDTRKDGLEAQKTSIEAQISDALTEKASAETAAKEMLKFVNPV